jgi:hypothetical protein
MSTRSEKQHISARGGIKSTLTRVAVIVLLAAVIPTQAAADTDTGALVRSLLLPGLGQAHQGHYTRAAIYSGVAVFSGFGILLTQVHYNEAVDKYEAQRDIYTGYQDQLNSGQIVSIDDVNSTYDQMTAEFNSAEDRLKWRNTMITVFVATYVVNLVDVLISKPYTIDENDQLGLIVAPDKIMVTKTIRF